MTETVTSKLTSGFWAILILLCKNDNADDQLAMFAYMCVSLFCVILLSLIFLISPPKKIIVSKESISIKNYITGKQIVILYHDIDSRI